ncbi:hypothetical protein [Anaerosporobacter sp.]
MANQNNDLRILELKKQIETKKKYLSGRKVRFTPETNCILELDGSKHNLNVLDGGALMFLMLKLNLYNMSADNLKMPHPTISGYSVDLWINDIKSKLSVSGMKREEADLHKMEAKLDKLLSEEKKTELEIDEIAALLN